MLNKHWCKMGTYLAKVRVYNARQLSQHLLCPCFKCHLHAHALHVTSGVGQCVLVKS